MIQSKDASDFSPLLFAASAHHADPLYFGKVSIPDPFIAFGTGSRKVAVVNALEFSRVRRNSDFDEVLPLEEWTRRARETHGEQAGGPAEIISLLAKEYGIEEFTLPEDFPAGLAFRLRDLGVRFRVSEGPLFPSRMRKTAREARAIAEGNACSAAGIAAAASLLRSAKIKAGYLFHRGRKLTSEALKIAIETACLENGGVSMDTIAAGGDQACDPHERGSGPLRANELIIVDVFPRISRTGFHGDMTRTFLRGRASDAQRAIVEAVRAAQMAALAKIRAGVNGRDVHQACVDVFTARGFKTERTSKGAVGFFHGTGHGIGLEVHEPPRVSTVEHILQRSAVVTVEPGLYYRGIGACRIEDVVQITAGKPKMLSDAPYKWEFR
ncbi:MAG: M24 family metallopeptidase [Opitutaceae bacterium]|nr:M24 family metallopeptidase [Opitutaceae bacterium]